MPYIRLKRVKHIRVAGVQQCYRPGDWVDVGKQTAFQWLSDGSAEIPGPDASKMEVIKELLGSGCGVRVRQKHLPSQLKQGFGNCVKTLEFSSGPLALPYRYTMLWHPSVLVTPQLVLIGFSQITSASAGQISWEMVARLKGTELACNVGSKEEQAKTKTVVGDLRIPVYDTKVLWVRKTKKTEKLIRWLAAAVDAGENEAHAFLRALYTEGILLCTLPAT